MIGKFYGHGVPTRRGAAIEDTIKAQLVECSDFHRTGIAGPGPGRNVNIGKPAYISIPVHGIDQDPAAVPDHAHGLGRGGRSVVRFGAFLGHQADIAGIPAFRRIGRDRSLLEDR